MVLAFVGSGTGCVESRRRIAPASDPCSGSYVCGGSLSASFAANLEMRGGECGIDLPGPGFQGLAPDGAVHGGAWDYWQTTAIGEFQLCDARSGSCDTCTRVADAPRPDAGASSAGACTGSPSSCYGRYAGTCSEIDGCYQSGHVTWDGDIEYECEGYPDACSSMRDARSCARQGCAWR